MKRRAAVFGRKGASGRQGANAAGNETVTGEQRTPRKPVRIPAKILFCSGAMAIDVVVRDVSETGARIVTDRKLPATRNFSLALEGTVRPCNVIWERDGALGVHFT